MAHPYNPPHLIPLVEIAGAQKTVLEAARQYYSRIGKKPIIVKQEAPGHIANRLSSALWR